MNEDNVKLNCETQEALSKENPLSTAAQRALAEAKQRREQYDTVRSHREIGGRGGQDPARFGDWEIKGRAIDF